MIASWSAVVRRHFVLEKVLYRLVARAQRRHAVAMLRRWQRTACTLSRNARVLVTLLRRRWREVTRQFLHKWKCQAWLQCYIIRPHGHLQIGYVHRGTYYDCPPKKIQATILSHDRMWVARVRRQRQTSNKLRIMLAEAIRQIKENQVGAW